MSKSGLVAVGALCLLVLFVTSAYGQETVTLTVNSAYGSPDPSVGVHSYAKGTVITASVATPVPGGTGIRYACVGWKSKGDPEHLPPVGSTNSVTFTITKSAILTWKWKAQYRLTVNVAPEAHCVPGHVDIWSEDQETPTDGYWGYKRVAQLRAVENEGYDFAYWSGGSLAVRMDPTANPTAQQMRRPETITANFVPEPRSFAVISAQGEPVPAVGTYALHYDDLIEANCGPDPYPAGEGAQYVCTGHDGAGDVSAGSETSISFYLHHDSLVTWLWQLQYYLATSVLPEGGGTVTSEPPCPWCDASAVVTLTATPNAGYVFANWSGDLSGTENPNYLTIYSPKSVMANFEQIPVADFIGTPTSGNVPLSVQFTDAFTGNITSWEWNFGAGASPPTANTQGPHSVTYSRVGLRTVSLKVTGPRGSDTKTKADYINVLPGAPVANFNANLRSAIAPPVTVHFTDESTGDITSWEWDFDNNGTVDSTEQNPSHTYTGAGVYGVRLTVTGPGGRDDETKNYIRVCDDANAIYVRTGGSDTNDGLTWALAKRTIQAGINAASNDWSVRVAKGTYNIAGDYNLDFGGKAIHLKGVEAGGSYDVGTDWIIDGANTTGRRGFVFQTSETAHSVVDNFTIRRCIAPAGDDGGAVYCTGASPTIINCRIGSATYGNKGDNAGGIYCYGGSNLTITNCAIQRNAATAGDGGGIYCDASSPRISGCTIGIAGKQNTATGNSGGGIYCYHSSPRITDCTIEANEADVGAGIYCDGSSPLIATCTIKDNLASGTAGTGGGIYLVTSSNATITNCMMSGNSATYWGGGIYCESSTPAITNCTIGAAGANSAGDIGGGICLYSSNPAINNCVITNNSAVTAGGGIECWNNSNAAITNCLIANNSTSAGTSDDGGGGIYCTASSNPTITNCTIANNTAAGNGGGIYCFVSSPVLNNTILWGNTAALLGHQIYTWTSQGSPCTVTLNYSDYANNTLDSNNIAGYGTVTATNHCIVSDPLFVDAGGGDYHLDSTTPSPCNDTGRNSLVPAGVTIDLDGNPRIINGVVDMGAYEWTTTLYYLTVVSSYGDLVGEGWYNAGTTATWSVTSPWPPGATGTRYVTVSTSGTVLMDAPKTVTVTWAAQYYLTIDSLYGDPQGAGWYDPGSTATWSVTSPWSGGTGVQYITSVTSGTVLMDSPETVTVLWTPQYELTTTVSPSGSGTIARLPDTAWYNLGKVVQLTATASAGYTFYCWSGDLTGSDNPVNIIMNGPKNIAAQFRHALVVTSPYGSPNPPVGTTYYATGSSVTVSCGSTPLAGPAGTQYVCTGWTDGSGNIPATGVGTSYGPFTINQNSAIIWTWKTQYYLTISVLPVFPYIGGTVSPPGGWFDQGLPVSLTATPNTGFAFGNWSGDLSGTENPKMITMNSGKTVTANFIPEKRYFTVNSAYGEPVPAVGTHEYDYGTTVNANCGPTPYSGGAGIQYVCTGRSGTGNVTNGSETSISFTITVDSSVTWTWQTQYYLTIDSVYGDPQGEGWYNEGGIAHWSVTSPWPPGATGTRYVTSPTSGDVLMDSPKTVTVTWITQYQLTTTVSPVGSGTIARSPDATWYTSGAVVQLTAVANTGYLFDHWSGDLTGTENPKSMTMDGPKSVTANFAPQAPVADFSGTPTSGSAPLTVGFTDASTGSITSWAWDFDNNGTVESTSPNPSYTYTSPGVYTVRLTVTGPGGSDDELKADYITVSAPGETTICVDGTNGDDANDGLSWATAVKTIQKGLDKATNGWTVLVANRTYTGTGNKDLDFHGKAIHLNSVGGAANCIIDCENSGRGFYFHSGETNDAIVEGFTIQNGSVGWGGGVGCYYSSPTFTNCTISGNTAYEYGGGGVCCAYFSSPTFTNCAITGNLAYWGGGVFCDSSNPTFTNCIISGNWAAWDGGGVECAWVSSPTFTNCTISGNSAYEGGGVYCYYDSSPALTNCAITGNSADYGGSVYCWGSSPTFTNCAISGNSATSGGCVCCSISDPTFTNCAISGNSAYECGGGVYCCSSSNPTFRNSIIWGNTANSTGNQIYVDTGSVTLSYSCYANGTNDVAGAVNPDNHINDDPQFVDAANKNYHLQGTSPCIDRGNNSYVPAGETTDLDGNPRIQNGTVDLGAYEYCVAIFVDGTNGSDTNNGLGWATAVKTIQKGLDVAGATGWTVLVENGTYTGTGNVNLTFKGKGIHLRSVGGAADCIIDCQKSGRGFFLDNNSPESVIEGFTIRNGNTGGEGGSIYCFHSSLTVKDCNIVNNRAYCGGGIFCELSSAVINNCIITNNMADWGGGIYYYRESTPVTTNCIIADNMAISFGGGIRCDGACPIITNCTIVGNSTRYKGGGIACSADVVLNNNILWGNSASVEGFQVYTSSGPTVTLNYCDYANGTNDVAGSGTVTPNNCINTDPQFFDTVNDNYRLQSISPCIDAGSNSLVPADVTADLEGNTRIVDGNDPPDGTATVDMGAYEMPLRDVPVANFTATQLGGGTPLTVQFTDTSRGIVTSWAWDFENDGTVDSPLQNPAHTYAGHGRYSVKLTVAGPLGSSKETKYIIVPPPLYRWTHRIGGWGDDSARFVCTDAGENVYVAGYFSGTVNFAEDWGGTDSKTFAGGTDISITKIGANSNYVWTREIGGAANDFASAICTDASGNVYVTGDFYSSSVNFAADWGGTDTKTNAGLLDIFITKINAEGGYGWSRRIGSGSYEEAIAVHD